MPPNKLGRWLRGTQRKAKPVPEDTMQSEPRKGLHVAIIMDGNGRWATRRGLPRVAGHRAGVSAVRRVVERSLDLGIARLTLYAFSSDNWRRPAAEVQSIFWLLRAFLRLESERLRRRGVRLRVIGPRDRQGRIHHRDGALSPAMRCRRLLIPGCHYTCSYWSERIPFEQ
jgi:undecaprenyl pyrophosphate synthase